MKVKLDSLRQKVYQAKREAIKRSAKLTGKRAANVKLVKLVHKVKDHMIDAEGRAQRSAADAKWANRALAKMMAKKTRQLTPKQQLDKLLSTPCQGKACAESGKFTSAHVSSAKMQVAKEKATALTQLDDRQVAP